MSFTNNLSPSQNSGNQVYSSSSASSSFSSSITCNIGSSIGFYSADSPSVQVPCPKSLQSLILRSHLETFNELVTSYSVTCSSYPSLFLVSGTSGKSVDEFVISLQQLITTVSLSCRPTHFLALPLMTSAVTRDQYTSFLSVLESSVKESPKFIPQQLVVPRCLHLTLMVLNLYTVEDIQQVKQILSENFDRLREMLPTPFTLHLGQLGVMVGTVDSCNILHFEIQQDENRKKVEEFTTAVKKLLRNYISPQNYSQSLKLHATVLNTKYYLHEKIPNASVNVEGILSFDSSVFDPINIPCVMLYKMQKDDTYGFGIEKCFPLYDQDCETLFSAIKNC
ncbi:hypothetical protein RCL1_002250 [Eukaryota sp. TZLM3-RCL]